MSSSRTMRHCRHGFTLVELLVVMAFGRSLIAGHVAADTPTAKVEPMLDPKPAVLRKLAALRPNQAVILGNAEVVGEFNGTAKKYGLHKTGPEARDFTLRMCWAPDRKRALYCGANHAVPHRLNDVWEFDLPSLTWVLLYAPDLPRGYGDLGNDTSDVEFKEGILVTKRGGPAVIAHTWWGLSYDPRRKALLFMNTWVTDRKQAVTALGGDPVELYAGPPLWAFFPVHRTWKPFKAAEPYPVAIFGGLLQYIPELGGSVWHANNWQMRGTWLHDFDKNVWTDLKANGGGNAFETESPQPEQIGYYDPKRKILVVQRHYDTHHFDPKRKEWKKVLAGDEHDVKLPFGHDARSVLYHDPHSGHGLLVQFQTNTLWAERPLGLRLVGSTYLGGSDAASQSFEGCKRPFLSIITSHLPEHVPYDGTGLNQLDPTRLYFMFDYAPRVYYIYEGACYHNALGLTIATASTPTAKPVTGDSYVVFPFVHSSISPVCSSGSGKRSANEPLMAGDFVQLPTIKAGQQLAFFVMAEMDRNANPAEVYYNGSAYNVDGYQHMVSFFPDNSQYIIIGFEDMYDCGGRERDGRERDGRERDGRGGDGRGGDGRDCADRDCNDLMFVIDIGPKNAAALRSASNLPR